MLFDPNEMPNFHKVKNQKQLRKTEKFTRKTVSMRQDEKSKHREPSIYVATKVEKRKS